MVSNNINLKNNIPMQAGIPQPLPTMQGVDGEKLKQSVDNSYLANRVKASSGEESNPLATLGIGTAVWYCIAQGMDKLNPKMEGKYENTILGKMGAWGDKVATNATKGGIGKKFDTFLRKLNIGWWKLSKKSDIVYSLRNHSTAPEWDFAKVPGKGLQGFLASDTAQVFEEFLKPISDNKQSLNLLFFEVPIKRYNSYQKLEQYGVSQKYIDDFVKTLKGLSFDEKALALQKEELKLLGVSDDIIKNLADKNGLKGLQKLAYNLKVKKLGFNSVSAYKALGNKLIDYPKEVMQALSKADPNLKVSIWRKNGLWGKIKSHLFGRRVSLSEYHNKYIATLGKGNKTALGRFLPKAFSWFLEGTTNRFAGGKLAVAMQAGIFADMLINTFKAPKGEKGKTFSERFINDFTYFMAMPLGIVAMHKIGGFKFLGLTTKEVKEYDKAYKLFKADYKAGKLADKAIYKQRYKELNNMLKANVKNPIARILKGFGKNIINIGNGVIPKRNWFANGCSLFFKNLVGVPLRIAIPMLIIVPFLAKNATKVSHFLFGKPTKSVLDEDKEETKNQLTPDQQAQMQKLVEEYQKQQQAMAQAEAQKKAAAEAKKAEPLVSNNSPTNLLTMTKNGNPYKNVIPHQEDAQQSQKPTYTYIPSPESVIVPNQGVDLTPAQAALQKADAMEKKVAETLSMRL